MLKCSLLVICLLAIPLLADEADRRRIAAHEPKMSYLDNGVIKFGVDLNLGGSVTYLSRSGTDQNLVNSWDFGRQIQMSYYSGPVPFTLPGKEMKKEWNFIGWNPIQVGDAFGHSSKLLEQTNDGHLIHVKCVPMHWPLDNVPGECTFECWFELEGPAVQAYCRFFNNRPDHTKYPARTQELPAVYTNGPWHRLMTYTGTEPFTDGPLTRIEKRKDEKGPWSQWIASESWAALVDDNNFGLGILSPDIQSFSGGFSGKPGAGGTKESPTGYIAPNANEIIDWNIEHEFRYELIVGKLDEIRKYAVKHAPRPAQLAWVFEKNRQGWSYHEAEDTGWPIRGELNVSLDRDHPILVGPVALLKASVSANLVIDAALKSNRPSGRLYWRGLADKGFTAAKSMAIALPADGEYHATSIKLVGVEGWDGAVIQLRLDPVGHGAAGDWIKIRSIRIEPVKTP